MSIVGKHRWFIVAVFFAFILLHQADKLLIGPLTTPIMETFKINEAQMGAVFTGALVVGAIFYPLWGYLYDRFTRPKLLALASFIWGSTTWLSALAPSYPAFLATRASTGIDDSSYPGLYSLTADYFEPHTRGKIYGLLEIAMPIGYLLGMILALSLRDVLGWRGVFYLTGSMGIILAAIIFFGVKDVPRGKSEPELAELEQIKVYKFDWKVARGLFRKPTLLFLYTQGFFGVFPWNVITYWFFRYLETERGYSSGEVMVTMVAAVLVLALGYFVGGALGDFFFRRIVGGRIFVSIFGVIMGAVLLLITMNIPLEAKGLFLLMLCLTALFIPFAAPNVISTVYDVTLPEVRSTALAVQYFIESAGAALSPLMAGIIAVRADLKTAILVICVSAWLVCAFFFSFAAWFAPKDIRALREQLRLRAEEMKVTAGL